MIGKKLLNGNFTTKTDMIFSFQTKLCLSISQAQDLGTNPGPLSDTKTYYLQVTDYNYNVPVIKFPIAGKKIALSEVSH